MNCHIHLWHVHVPQKNKTPHHLNLFHFRKILFLCLVQGSRWLKGYLSASQFTLPFQVEWMSFLMWTVYLEATPVGGSDNLQEQTQWFWDMATLHWVVVFFWRLLLFSTKLLTASWKTFFSRFQGRQKDKWFCLWS